MSIGKPAEPVMQIPLPSFFPPRATFEQFWPGGNQQLVHHLQAIAAGSNESFLFVWGPRESGKSHLLQAACHSAHRAGRTASYLPLRNLSTAASPEMLEGLEEQQLVCIDDIGELLGDFRREEALFHLYNASRELGHCLTVTSDVPPGDLPARLPDLHNRLSWGAVYRIHPLNGDDTLAAIDLCAAELGLLLPPPVKRFLMMRCQRDFGSLRRLLLELDRATLSEQRRLSVPLVKQVLARIP